MQITDIRIRLVPNDEKLKGVASVTIDDCFVVHDIKIIMGADRLFVAMPSRKAKDGTYKDVCHPIKQDVRDTLSELVLKAYEEALAAPAEE